MNLPFKSVSISTIIHSTESREKIENALRLFIPKGVELEDSEAEGHYGDSKIILSADIERRPHMREFWDKVMKNLSQEDKNWLLDNAIDRIGDDCRLYLRFDKQTAVTDEKLALSDSGDVFHIRINISAYPAKREIAIEKMKEFIESDLEYG